MGISMSLRLPLTMPTRLMLRDKRLSRGTKDNSGRPSKALKTKLVAVKKSWKLLVLLSVRLVLSVERLKNLVLFLDLLTEPNTNLTQNLLMLALPSQRCQSSMARLCMQPRTLRISPRELWLMLPDLLMNCVLNKTMSQLNLGQRGLLIPNLVNLKVAWLMLKPLP